MNRLPGESYIEHGILNEPMKILGSHSTRTLAPSQVYANPVPGLHIHKLATSGSTANRSHPVQHMPIDVRTRSGSHVPYMADQVACHHLNGP